jgi:hypothetical protein
MGGELADATINPRQTNAIMPRDTRGDEPLQDRVRKKRINPELLPASPAGCPVYQTSAKAVFV